MLKINFFGLKQEPTILCLGAHPDDIEIGCGGTLLRLSEEVPKARYYWVVFSGDEKRRKEAVDGSKAFLSDADLREVIVKDFRDSYFPFVGSSIKDFFETLKTKLSPDIIFSPFHMDAHQDHRLISRLTWNTFRDNMIFEYEIPKYEGDLKTPNLYVTLSESQAKRKVALINSVFKSQKGRTWFSEETLFSILRIRAIESNALERYAEGFHCRKIIF